MEVIRVYQPAGPTVIDRRTVSPLIQQEFAARGVAQVIVILRAQEPVMAAASTDVASSFARYFVQSELSVDAAIDRARPKPRVGLSKRRPVPSVRHYPNLGVLFGTVSPDSLSSLQADPRVATVTGAPELSLIRPHKRVRVAAAGDQIWGAAAMGIPRLWDEGLKGDDILVGHLDTGADGDHPALKNAIEAFTDTDADGDLKASSPYDSGEHGTHTAGIIAGRSRGIGVAPGARLVSAIVIESGNHVPRILGGLNWAIGKGVRILNLSFGMRGWWTDFEPLIDAIRQKNILPVVAVGNEGPGTSRSPGNYPNVLSVGAFDSNDTIWSDSSSQRFNRTTAPLVPGLVAPGVAILSAKPGGGYQMLDGTSMAAPHIAALAALLMQAKPDATAAQVEQAIYDSCTLRSGMDSERANRGVPDAVAALATLTGTRLGRSTGGMPVRKTERKRVTKRRMASKKKAVSRKGRRR